MEIGEEGLARPQHRAFAQLRFFDFDHKLGVRKHLLLGLQNVRACFAIAIIGSADPKAGTLLDCYAMACANKFGGAFWRKTDAMLIELDLSGAPNPHIRSLSVSDNCFPILIF
jgi:hypothetical protein